MRNSWAALPACWPHTSALASVAALILQFQVSSAGAGAAAQDLCSASCAVPTRLLQAEERHSHCRLKTALREQRSRWDLLAQAEQNFTVAESFTLGWFNVLLRHLWPTLIEKEVSDSVTKELRVRAPCHGGLPAGSYDQPLCRWWFNMLLRHLWLTLIEKKAPDHVNRELR